MHLITFLLPLFSIIFPYRPATAADELNSYGEIVFKMPNFKAFSAGKGPIEVQSAEVIINGLPWAIRIRHNREILDFHTCIQLERPDFGWSCNAAAKLSIVSAKMNGDLQKGELNVDHTYTGNTDKTNCWGFDGFIAFKELMAPEKGFYNERDDAVTFKAQVKAQKPTGILQIRAEHPLKINEELVHVNKYILAAHSEYFKKLFFGENGKAASDDADPPKIEAKQTENAVEKFKQLFSIFNSPNTALDDNCAANVLPLAKQFNVQLNRRRGQIVFRVPNFRAFSQGNADVNSDKVFVDGMSWQILISPLGYFVSIYLTSDFDDETDPNWSREAARKFAVVSPSKGDTFTRGQLTDFYVHDRNIRSRGYGRFASFEALMDPRNGAYDTREDTVTFKCEFVVKKKGPYQAFTFKADDNLRVNGQVVKVNKFLLAAHSEQFQDLFFGLNSVEPTFTINIIENAVEKFRQLIAFVNAPNAELDDASVGTVLLLADYFQLDSVVNRCANFLATKSKIAPIYKLMLASRYDLKGMEKKILEDTNGQRFDRFGEHIPTILFLLDLVESEDTKVFQQLRDEIREILGANKRPRQAENEEDDDEFVKLKQLMEHLGVSKRQRNL